MQAATMPEHTPGPVLPWMLHPDELAALYDYWLRQDPGSEVPLWHALDKDEVAPWLVSLFILRFPSPASDEIVPGGVGRKILKRLGFDPQDLKPDHPTRLFMEKCYLQARSERRPVYSENEILRPGSAVPVPYTRLALPYRNKDGVVDRLLCGIYFLAPGTRVDSRTMMLERVAPERPMAG